MFTEKTTQLFNDACVALGYDPTKVLPDVSMLPEQHRKSAAAYHMLIIIIEHAQKQKNWKPDYHSGNRKYWTWHEVKASEDKPAGFGFSYSNYYYDYTDSSVGSRLCFPDYETEREYAEQLEELYIAYKL